MTYVCNGCGGTSETGMAAVEIDTEFVSRQGNSMRYWICEVCLPKLRQVCDRRLRVVKS